MKPFTDKNEVTPEYLLQLISSKRKIMIKKAEKFGTGSEKILECSQELDILIVQYQRLIKSERTNPT